MRLVFASNNAHKLAEVRAMMPADIEVLSLSDIGFEQDIEENGKTLEENSVIKAEAVYQWILDNGQWTLDGVFADDTGLEIDALDGQPGVYTARWFLRDEGVKGLKDEREIFGGAQFRTVITLIWTQESGFRSQDAPLQVSGVVRGRIATEEHGEGGFGYDPIFIPEGYDKTFGELPAEVKNGISHRARALAALVKTLKG